MKMSCYANNRYKKNLMQKIAKISCRNDMKIDAVPRGAFIVNPTTGAFGVFDDAGNLIKSSLQYRGKTAQFIPKYVPSVEYMDCDAVFIGNVYPHFGHFLLEHLNRAWGISKIKSKNIKYVLVDNKNMGPKQWMIDFLKCAGVKESDILILNKSMRFNTVYVPYQSLNIVSGWYAPEFKDVFDIMRKNTKTDTIYDKVYVSRTKLSDDMRVWGEEQVQSIFEKNGFTVIYPETLPLAEQIAIISHCNVLAGCAGTALHLALTMKDGTRVIQLNRTSAIKDNGEIQYRLCKLKNQDFDIVAASVEEVQSTHGGIHAPQIIGVTKELQQFFDDNNFKYDDADLQMNADVLNQYKLHLSEFQKNNGGQLYLKFKKKFIKYISCLIPGRVTRGRVRKWLKEKM
jgi:capsular polysaccharide biosynthesis protein